jgi:hypothetical protein
MGRSNSSAPLDQHRDRSRPPQAARRLRSWPGHWLILQGMELFKYTPHPRLEHLKANPPISLRRIRGVHAGPWMTRFNAKLGLGITEAVGTMWCAYAFACLALVSLPAAIRSHDPVVMVSWLSQTFLQLVLLSIIIVGQNIQAKGSESQAQATYEDAKATLEDAQQIQQHLLAQDEVLGRLIQATQAAPR